MWKAPILFTLFFVSEVTNSFCCFVLFLSSNLIFCSPKTDVVIVDSRPDSLTTETKSQEVHFVKTTTDQVDPVQSTSSDKTDTTLIPAGKTTVEGLSPELTTEGSLLTFHIVLKVNALHLASCKQI